MEIMLIMTRNMLASEGCGRCTASGTLSSSLIFNDFSKLFSSCEQEASIAACLSFFAATRSSNSSSSLKSISISFPQKASGKTLKVKLRATQNYSKKTKEKILWNSPSPSSSDSFPLTSSSSSEGASLSSLSNPSKNFSDGINRKTLFL